MQIDIVDRVTLDPQKLAQRFPRRRDGRSQAVNDISIADSLNRVMGVDATLARLHDIVAD